LTVDFEEDDVKYKDHFDVSKLQHKNGNEKKEIIYELKKIQGKEITFNILYSERGRKTKTDAILKEFKKKNIHLDEERLNKVFRIFEKQNEVDYFINKNAESFLKEQFDLWLKNYVFDDESDFSEKRLKQLKVLKGIAYKVIDFVAQFEDELVKIWNKPKFVLNSNYVITLDKIKDVRVIENIIKHKGFEEQVKEWKELGILKAFDKKKLFTNTLKGKELSKDYATLPIDTKYFDENIKLEILSLFDDLDNQLDGWLIHSENYQALKTIMLKFKEKVQTCYIDPPFNLGTNADFMYNVNYKDANWITLLDNRVNLARDLLNDEGSMFVRCDYNGNMYVRMLMNQIFGEDNYNNELTILKTKAKQIVDKPFTRSTESLFYYAKTSKYYFKQIEIPIENADWNYLLDFPRPNKNPRTIMGREFFPPRNRRWALSQTKIDHFEKNGKVKIDENREYINCLGNKVKGYPMLLYDTETLRDYWTDVSGYAQGTGFSTENSEVLLKRVQDCSSKENDIILDFFLGSGTTIAVAHKLKRKWIGIEMGDHFNDFYFDSEEKKVGVKGRMKKVLFGISVGISKEVNWKGGGFFKYFDLEQYEQTLKNAVYKDSHPFVDFKEKSIYNQYVFMKDLKLLEAMKLDSKSNKIDIDFSKLYSNIDLSETISNIKGKQIKKVEKNAVVLEGNEKIEYDKIDFNLVRNLIWW
jgi:adenine specific DNA methylase Mod